MPVKIIRYIEPVIFFSLLSYSDPEIRGFLLGSCLAMFGWLIRFHLFHIFRKKALYHQFWYSAPVIHYPFEVSGLVILSGISFASASSYLFLSMFIILSACYRFITIKNYDNRMKFQNGGYKSQLKPYTAFLLNFSKKRSTEDFEIQNEKIRVMSELYGFISIADLISVPFILIILFIKMKFHFDFWTKF